MVNRVRSVNSEIDGIKYVKGHRSVIEETGKTKQDNNNIIIINVVFQVPTP